MTRRWQVNTIRPEETSAFDSAEGYHQFHAEETQEPYGSLEVFHATLFECNGCGFQTFAKEGVCCEDERWNKVSEGWFWWACFPGCMPDGDFAGPFATSRQALEDADEWNPEFDES